MSAAAPQQASTNAATSSPVLTFLGPIGATGNLSIVTPCAIDWLPEWAPPAIARAERTQIMGDVRTAATMVLTIERRLKVTDEMRFQAAASNDDHGGDVERVISRTLASFPRLKRLPDFARPKAKNRPPKADNDHGEYAEVVQLHALRGDTVVVDTIDSTDRNEGSKTLKAGKVQRARILSRDGLLVLGVPTKRGNETIPAVLTKAQVAAGLMARQDYEMIDPQRSLKAQDLSSGGSAGMSFSQEVSRELRITKAREQIADLERAIQAKDPTHNGSICRDAIHGPGRAVACLRWVAGLGNSLHSLSGGGKAYTAYRDSLILALDVAGSRFGTQ